LFDLISSISAQVRDSETLVTSEQFKDISDCISQLELLFTQLDHPYITKIFDRLLSQNAQTVKEQSQETQAALNTKLTKLNTLLKGK
jgi:hypothetical protein